MSSGFLLFMLMVLGGFFLAILTILLISYARVAMAYFRSRYRRHHRQSRGLCPSCGYDLTGNVTGICPECGEPLRGAGRISP